MYINYSAMALASHSTYSHTILAVAILRKVVKNPKLDIVDLEDPLPNRQT